MKTNYVLITGASAGIGLALAHQFAKQKYSLILVARRQDRLQALKEELEAHYQIDVVIQVFDLGQTDQLDAFYDRLSDYSIQYWINNVGFSVSKDLLDLSSQELQAMIAVNDTALALLSNRYASDYKDVEGAQLVNVSSVVGYALSEGSPFYSATKFFVSAFTEGLDHYLQSKGHALRAKVIAPAATATEFTQVARGLKESVNHDEIYDRYHTAEEMAAFIIELIHSDKTVGRVNMQTFEFQLLNPQLPDLY